MDSTGATVPGSSQNDVVVSVRDLHVEFKVYEERKLRSQDLVRRGLRTRRAVKVHAVRGVSFDIRAGEAVGLVGSNGSGKSTTLRAIAGLEPITDGEVLVRYQPHLLGVGAALRPRLSGRRNIVLGSLALGLPLREVEGQIESVVEFSGLADAIDRPLETYSSGMRARLAFSIATLRSPEILLIDEALAVGDRSFRTRSLQRVRDIQAGAGTIVMVTHNLGEIKATCERAIWIDRGLLKADGPTAEVLAAYVASQNAMDKLGTS